MSKTNDLENDVLKKVFQKIEFDWEAVTNLYVSLHTADPGEGGNQNTNECAYTGYARKAVVRSTAGWDVANGTANNKAEIVFGLCTALTTTAVWVGVGTLASGAGKLLYRSAFNESLAISSGVTPKIVINALQTKEE